MQDARIQQLARTLVYHSCQVKSRDIVVIEFSGIAAMPLVHACIEEITYAGGIPFCFFHSDQLMRSFFVQRNRRTISRVWCDDATNDGSLSLLHRYPKF